MHIYICIINGTSACLSMPMGCGSVGVYVPVSYTYRARSPSYMYCCSDACTQGVGFEHVTYIINFSVHSAGGLCYVLI